MFVVGIAAGLLERGNIEAFRGIIEDKEREMRKRLAPSVTICGPKPIKPAETKEPINQREEEEDGEEDDDEEEKVTEPKEMVDETVSVDRVIWMWEEQEAGWLKYPPEVSRQLEVARRDGKSKYLLKGILYQSLLGFRCVVTISNLCLNLWAISLSWERMEKRREFDAMWSMKDLQANGKS